MKPRVTMQDVARAAGVGKATVSLALRNHPRISAATRARVQAVAKELQYRPDPALSQIAAHRWRTREHPTDFAVAFVTFDHPWTKEEALRQLRTAAAGYGEERGYRVERFRAEDYARPEKLARVLFHRGIRGALVGPILREDFVARFPWESFVCVGCHIGYHQPPVEVVAPDFHHSMARAWEEAYRAGYRRIGVAMLEELEAVDLFDKVSAALFCQLRLHPELEQIPLQHFPDDGSGFREWVDRHRPDVVIGFNDSVYWWLLDCGYRVPNDIAFVSLDTESRLSQGEGAPVIAGMNPDYERIGRTALDQLDIRLRLNEMGPQERPLVVHVQSEWIPGETLPPRAAPAS